MNKIEPRCREPNLDAGQ